MNALCVRGSSPSPVNARKSAIPVGQDGSLRGDCQSPQVPIDNRHAACQAAPQKHAVEELAMGKWVRAKLHKER